MGIDRYVRFSTLALIGGIFLALVGCSAAQDPSGTLQRTEVRPALRALPFQHKLWAVKPPAGDEAAFRGVAHGKYRATLHFSIGLGAHPITIPVPRTRLQDPVGEGEAGFAFNGDAADAKKFKTVRQWHAAMDMATEIEETLCKQVTGKPCPV
jgi:hypothetical protein